MKYLILFILIVASVPGLAQEELNDDRKVEKRPEINVAMTEPVYKRLAAIHEMMGEDKLSEALDALRRLSNQRLTKYEDALLKQTFGFVYVQQNNAQLAIKSFEEALATGSLPGPAHQGMLYSLAGLYASERQFMKSIETMRDWFRYEANPLADAYIMVGSSFAELDRFQDALPYVLKAIEKSEKPQENWYMLALAIYFEQKDFSRAATLLEAMLKIWPGNARYWDMLAGCYLELGQDRRALDVMMVSYNNGMLKAPEKVRSLAQLNMMNDVPFTAGIILEKGIASQVLDADEDVLKLLLQAWLSAREYDKAVDTIVQLQPYAKDGKYLFNAAQIYSETGEWQKTVEFASRALESGLDDPVDALMLLGAAQTELGQFNSAVETFTKVRSIGDKKERDNVNSWLQYIEEKRQLESATVRTN
jgi:tetratricopeptide (TPR) repeat protein